MKAVVNGQVIYNVYDASGSLVHIDAADDPATPGYDPKVTDYVTGPMGTLARISNNAVTYLHPDQLGSAQSGTNSSGTVAWREQYTPFGEELQSPAANDNLGGFTGHIRDKSTGLNYMQARYYDPVIGRFLSVDPMGFLETGEPGQFNRYAYTWNNPINANDPDGEFLKILKSVYNVGKRTYKNGGNFKGALKDEALSYVENGVTLLDSNASFADKAFAVFDLATGFGDEAKGAKRILSKTTCCFVAGTLVETEDGLRPIEDIRVGDLVLARDPETGETAYKEVTAFTPRHDRVIWTVALEGTNARSENFETTDEYPWWIIDETNKGSWKRTDELTAGMVVTTADNHPMTITSALQTNRTDGTYNITVADFETYFVGESKVLVHNCGKAKAYDVGPADQLRSNSVIGDGLDIHHVPQSNPASQVIVGFDPKLAPSIALPAGEHRSIPTIRGDFDGNARDLLAKDIRDLRANTNAPNSSLRSLVRQSKKQFPELNK